VPSAFRPNTLVSVFLEDAATEDTEDVYGYPAPNTDPGPLLADVADWPAYRSAAGQKVTQNGDGQRTVITRTRFRLRPRAGVPAIDPQARIKDQITGLFYLIDEMPSDVGMVHVADVVLICRRVT
jgi:hypothetical protein